MSRLGAGGGGLLVAGSVNLLCIHHLTYTFWPTKNSIISIPPM